MKIFLQVTSIIADLLTIAAYWQFNQDSSLWKKVFFTVFLLIILALTYITAITDSKIPIFDYSYDTHQNKITAIISKNSTKLILSSLVSVYYKPVTASTSEVVAVGTVSDIQSKRTQIDIVNIVDNSKLNEIIASGNAHQNYYILPYVEYSYIEDILKVKEDR